MTTSVHDPSPSPPGPPGPPSPSPLPDPAPGPTNPIPPPAPGRGLRRRAAAVMLALLATVGCGGDQPATSGTDPMPAAAPEVSRVYVGCIGPTGTPDTFVLSVAEGRDFTTGEPPGTPIPQKSELPPGSPPPTAPVPATPGSPGGGPTPTTAIATYTLVGDGGTNLGDHLGHTVEVTGAVGRAPEGQISGSLIVTAVRHVADHCK